MRMLFSQELTMRLRSPNTTLPNASVELAKARPLHTTGLPVTKADGLKPGGLLNGTQELVRYWAKSPEQCGHASQPTSFVVEKRQFAKEPSATWERQPRRGS